MRKTLIKFITQNQREDRIPQKLQLLLMGDTIFMRKRFMNKGLNEFRRIIFKSMGVMEMNEIFVLKERVKFFRIFQLIERGKTVV